MRRVPAQDPSNIRNRRRALSSLLIAALITGCGPSSEDIASRDRTIAELRSETKRLEARVADLEQSLGQAQNTPEAQLVKAQRAFDRKDYSATIQIAERLVHAYPNSDRVPPAKRLAATARALLAKAQAQAHAEAERNAIRAQAAERAAKRERLKRLRADLHKNLDGAGGGFVRRWEMKDDVLVLVIDPSEYIPNRAVAAAITARTMFDMNDVPLPSILIFRDTAGNELDRGPFANVPRVAP
jgi:hypothetical protein